MPCYDSRNDRDYVKQEALEEFRHNSPVAEMLCTMMKLVDPSNVQHLPADIQQWWIEHQVRDANKKGAKK